MSTETNFKIDSVYTDAAGRILRLRELTHDGRPCDPGEAWCQVLSDGRWWGDGFRTLADGRDPSNLRLDCGIYRHLLPGELHQVTRSWVPVEGKPAKSIEFTTALHPITKKVVPVAISYGPGYEAVHFTVDLGRPVRTSIAEPKREPLTWNKPVKVDRFPGFTSTYDGPVIANEGEGLGVQRISPIDRDPKNGSAFLKEMKG